MERDVSIQELRGALTYDPETGSIFWRHNGKPALSTKKAGGYFHGSFKGQFIRAHRAAWAIHFGEWPAGQIDHINGDPSDNRIANLRDTTPKQNSANGGKRPGRNPSSKYIGVCRARSKWEASVGHRGKTVRAGLFHTEIEAARARDRLALRLNGQFARLNFPKSGEKA